MQQHIKKLSLVLIVFIISSFTIPNQKSSPKKEKTRFVLIETIYGNMKIQLYNETPLHRDNFLKLVNEKYYDSLIFHRVIKDFMIQGGDPQSKGAAKGKMLGNGGPGYTIDAEIRPNLFHKKGALAAAREGDQVNPEKKSSGSQFYIVQGTTFTEDQLHQMEDKINFPKRRELVMNYIEQPENAAIRYRLDSLQRTRNLMALNMAYNEIAESLNEEYNKLDLFKYTPEQIQAYTTIGGTPHLDQNYTVFGEVVEGLNVIDSIATVETDKNDRPLKDVIIKIKVVKK